MKKYRKNVLVMKKYEDMILVLPIFDTWTSKHPLTTLTASKKPCLACRIIVALLLDTGLTTAMKASWNQPAVQQLMRHLDVSCF